MSTAHPLEYVFLVVTVPGAVVAWYVLRKAMYRMGVLKENKINGFLHDGASQTLTREAFKMLIHGLMVATAVGFLFMEPPFEDGSMPLQSKYGVVMMAVIALANFISSAFAAHYLRRHAKKFDAVFPFHRRFEDIATREEQLHLEQRREHP